MLRNFTIKTGKVQNLNMNNIKLKDFKNKIYNAGLLNYRLFHMIDGHVNVKQLPLLWETKKTGDWRNIGDNKYDEYYIQEFQTNEQNTLDILISKVNGPFSDDSNK